MLGGHLADESEEGVDYDSFLSFMRNQVLPHQAAHPDYIRLDGALSGGNLEVFGSFKYKDRAWVVHGDTHFEPLKVAYHAIGKSIDPFILEKTKHAHCLVLKKRLRPRPNAKYLYIYRAPRERG